MRVFAHEGTALRSSALPYAVLVRFIDLAVRDRNSDNPSRLPSSSVKSHPGFPTESKGRRGWDCRLHRFRGELLFMADNFQDEVTGAAMSRFNPSF